VTRARPEAGCQDLVFRDGYAIDEGGEVALEDYARTIGRAAAAELVRGAGETGAVTGVHLCAAKAPLGAAARIDIEDFARALAAGGAGGLGWS
jgi:hypothetical protein